MAVQQASQLVFVPTIGFRPAGTRTLRERAEVTQDDTRLAVLAVAAAPGRSDLVVEWERDVATCTADSRVVPPLVHSAPRDQKVDAVLMARTSTHEATAMAARAYSASAAWVKAVQTMTFAALDDDTESVELRVRWAGHEWRVPLVLTPASVTATALAVEAERSGVILRATAMGRDDDELIVAVEAEARWEIRQVGAPLPTPPIFSGDSEEDRRERMREIRRVLGQHAQPLTLEDDRGGRREEVRRLFGLEPQQTAPGQPFISRFSVIFDTPSTDASTSVLVVPFVALNDREHSVTADLRELPRDVQLGEYRFRVTKLEAEGADRRRITIEIPPSTTSPRFVHPARVVGADPENFGWEMRLADPASPNTIWMATALGDPPIVTFHGAVLRVDGPFRLEIPPA